MFSAPPWPRRASSPSSWKAASSRLLIFGWDKVGPKTHFFATLMVALGSTFSAVWIVVANSWMQTPDAGYHLVTLASGQVRAEVVDFWKVVFNPSTLDRLWHVAHGRLAGRRVAGHQRLGVLPAQAAASGVRAELAAHRAHRVVARVRPATRQRPWQRRSSSPSTSQAKWPRSKAIGKRDPPELYLFGWYHALRPTRTAATDPGLRHRRRPSPAC